MSHDIAVLVGSLRRDSINRQYARGLAKLAAPRLSLNMVEIGDLPLYNDDLWQDGVGPAPVMRMKEQIGRAAGVLIVTPEYNRAVPGLLVNALDWGSRPYGKSSFMGKPAACTGTSPGVIGTAAAQTHLKAQIDALGLIALGQPEVYLQWKRDLFDADGTCTEPETAKFLGGFLAAFANLVDRLA